MAKKVTGKWLSTALFEQETPAGTVNGSNTIFTTSSVPVASKAVCVYLDGLFQKPGGSQVTISGSTITFVTAPAVGQEVFCTYIKK